MKISIHVLLAGVASTTYGVQAGKSKSKSDLAKEQFEKFHESITDKRRKSFEGSYMEYFHDAVQAAVRGVDDSDEKYQEIYCDESKAETDGVILRAVGTKLDRIPPERWDVIIDLGFAAHYSGEDWNASFNSDIRRSNSELNYY